MTANYFEWKANNMPAQDYNSTPFTRIGREFSDEEWKNERKNMVKLAIEIMDGGVPLKYDLATYLKQVPKGEFVEILTELEKEKGNYTVSPDNFVRNASTPETAKTNILPQNEAMPVVAEKSYTMYYIGGAVLIVAVVLFLKFRK